MSFSFAGWFPSFSRTQYKFTPKKLTELEEWFEFGSHEDKKPVALRYLPIVQAEWQEKEARRVETLLAWRTRWEREEGTPPAAQEPFEEGSRARRAAFLRGVANVALLGDLAAGYFAGPEWIHQDNAGIIGAGVAGFTAFISRGLWGLSLKDHRNPTPALYRRERWLYKLFASAGLLVGSMALDRFFDLPVWLITARLTAICVDLSFLAAGSHVLAEEIETLNVLARRYQVLGKESQRLLTLVNRMKDVIEPSKGGDNVQV